MTKKMMKMKKRRIIKTVIEGKEKESFMKKYKEDKFICRIKNSENKSGDQGNMMIIIEKHQELNVITHH